MASQSQGFGDLGSRDRHGETWIERRSSATNCCCRRCKREFTTTTKPGRCFDIVALCVCACANPAASMHQNSRVEAHHRSRSRRRIDQSATSPAKPKRPNRPSLQTYRRAIFPYPSTTRVSRRSRVQRLTTQCRSRILQYTDICQQTLHLVFPTYNFERAPILCINSSPESAAIPHTTHPSKHFRVPPSTLWRLNITVHTWEPSKQRTRFSSATHAQLPHVTSP